MLSLSKVKFPAPVLKLHWPDRWCSDCMGETRTLPLDLYECESCGKVTMGRTEYVECTVARYNEQQTQ